MECLYTLDIRSFDLINRLGSVAWLDPLMLMLCDPLNWIPLPLGILVWSYYRMRGQCVWLICLSILSIALIDYAASIYLQPLIGRVRPCYNPALWPTIRELVNCGGLYAMPSIDAANSCCLAVFWYGCVRLMTGRHWRWLWVWPISACYAQVYVGGNYPGDVLSGAALGIGIGWMMQRLFRWFALRSSP